MRQVDIFFSSCLKARISIILYSYLAVILISSPSANTEFKNSGSEVKMPGLESMVCLKWPWSRYLTSLGLNLLVCKTQIKQSLPQRWGLNVNDISKFEWSTYNVLNRVQLLIITFQVSLGFVYSLQLHSFYLTLGHHHFIYGL